MVSIVCRPCVELMQHMYGAHMSCEHGSVLRHCRECGTDMLNRRWEQQRHRERERDAAVHDVEALYGPTSGVRIRDLRAHAQAAAIRERLTRALNGGVDDSDLARALGWHIGTLKAFLIR